MIRLRILAALLAASFLYQAHGAAAQSQTYRAEANSTGTIALSVCNPEVYVTIRGDGDTDLDFTIRNSRGEEVHSDDDTTDISFATLYRRDGVQCEAFTLEVINLGSVWNQYTVELETLRADAGRSSDAANRRVSLVNNTKETIYYLYWSNAAADGWGEDKLTTGVIASGQSWEVNVDDGSGACRFDFKAVTASERTIERRGVDVCSAYTISFK